MERTWKLVAELFVSRAYFGSLAFSADDTRLLAAADRLEPAGLFAIEYRTGSWRRLRSVRQAPGSSGYKVGYDPRGRIVFQDDGRHEKALERRAGIDISWAIAGDPSGRLVAVDGVKSVEIRDASTHRIVRRLPERGRVNGLAFSHDGKLLASVGEEWAVRVWDVATGKRLALLEEPQHPGYAVAFSHDGRYLAAGGKEATFRVWRC